MGTSHIPPLEMEMHNHLAHVAGFGGDIHYVNKGTGSDSNTGHSPCDAFETIGAGISASAAGDAINVKAGTYTETGLDMNLAGLELWCEAGVLIDPATGVGLTVSGASCVVRGPLKITPSAAVGMLVSGVECRISDVKIVGGTHCFHITGAGVILTSCAAGFPSAGNSGYNIQADQGRYISCSTVGDTTTYGFYINNNVDVGVIKSCSSIGHQTSGFYIPLGSRQWTVLDCSSGVGDGKWINATHDNAWANFTYADNIHKNIVFAGAPTTYNIFKITGTIQISSVYGVVSTQIANTSSVAHLQLYSTGGTVVLTKAVGGPDLDSLPVGTTIYKVGDAGVVLATNNSTTPSLIEFGTKSPAAPIVITADADQTTYVRLSITAALASGQIDWHCIWKPISDDGFLAAV